MLLAIKDKILSYSTLLVGADPGQPYYPLGSGTHVRVGDHQCLLTAAHVWTFAQRFKRFGLVNGSLQPSAVVEDRQLFAEVFLTDAIDPKDSVATAWGPDVALIGIPDFYAGRLEATGKVFYDLLRRRHERLGTPLDINAGLWVILGSLVDDSFKREGIRQDGGEAMAVDLALLRSRVRGTQQRRGFDYIDIALDNAIESLSATDIMDACYDATDYPNNESCSRITRDAGHQVTFIRTGYVNAGFRKFKGITSAIDWTFDVPSFGRPPGSLGSIELRANHLKTLDLVTQVGSASPNNQAGELTLNSTIVSKGAFSLDYRKGPFSWYWQGLYTGSTKFDNNDTENSKDILRVSQFWLFNTTLSYDVSRHFTARLLVDNVFDRGPPFPALAGTGGNFANATSIYFSGIMGRTYLLSVDVRL